MDRTSRLLDQLLVYYSVHSISSTLYEIQPNDVFFAGRTSSLIINVITNAFRAENVPEM